MRRAELRQVAELDNPACVIGPGESCEHALVDEELNRRLYAYEETVRGRFTPIVDTLKTISAFQHELDFESRAQRIAQDRNALEREIATLEAEQADLQADLEYARSDEYVASWARSEGKMVGENEVLVVPVPAGAPLPTATPIPPPINLFEPETETVDNWRLWWALFFDSEPPF